MCSMYLYTVHSVPVCLYTVHICVVCTCNCTFMYRVYLCASILYIYVQYVPVYFTYMCSMCVYTVHIYYIYTAVQFCKANAYESRYMSGYMYIRCSHNSNKTTLLCKQPILSIEMVTTICVGKCWLLFLANGQWVYL